MKNILILSGGGSHGSFEMGVVSKLINDGKGSWDLITGVSAGSINGCYLSTIEKNDEINNIDIFKNLWLSINNKVVYKNEYFFNGLSLFNSDKIKSKLSPIFQDKIPLRPVLAGATSLINSSQTIFNNEDFEKYGFTDIIMSSISIPYLFQPYAFNGDVFVDGGLTSNVLFDDAINYCIKNFPDESIHVDVVVSGKLQEPAQLDNLNFITFTERIVNIIFNQFEYSEIIKNIDFPSKFDITVYEQANASVSFLDFDKAEQLWDEGYTFSNVKTYNIEL